MKVYDIIIVGSGLAGLMAARVLKKNNINFLILDSRKEIGFPLRCGECTRKDSFIELFKTTKYDFIKTECANWEFTVCGTKKKLYKKYLMLDRPQFEKWLSKPVKDNIILDTTCKDIVNKKNYSEVITNKKNYRANLVILAYGSKYIIQKKFGLLDKEPLLIPCYGGLFGNHNLDTKSLHFFFGEKASVLWVFPKNKNLANAGVGVYPVVKKDIKQSFKKLLIEYNFDLKGKPTFAGVFPSSGPIQKTYSDRLLVCGDAAGQVFAGSGEGICFALKAGKLAGETAANSVRKKDFTSRFLKQYEKNWKRSFGRQLKVGVVFSEILISSMKYNLLKYCFKFSKEKELTNLLWNGKISIKARIFYYFTKLLNLLT